MSQYLFEEIVDIGNLEKAYKQALKGSTKYGFEALEFSINETANLMELRRKLLDGTYQFSGYIRFKVYEPKERIIDAPHFVDKIVQLAINDILKEFFLPTFIYDSYACLDNKGTHKAVERVSHFMRKASWEFGEEAFIVKLDVRKFFYTIDRDILKVILKEFFSKKIKCARTLYLLFEIIDSADDVDLLGLPLGNVFSQLGANIYMNKLDQYSKRKLSLRYYVRYADDVIVIVRNKDEANRILKLMIEFLGNHLALNVNEKKTKIFPIEQGVNAYGFKIYKTHRLLRNDSKKKIKRKTKKMRRLIAEGLMTVEKAEQILNSWKGHAEYGNSYNFIQRLIRNNDHIYMNEKGILKIDTNKVKDGDI